MDLDVQFLFDNQLIAELENLIRNSKNQLLLISPFIDLDKRIQDVLSEKLQKHDFQLRVLFGKNEDNHYKSIKKDSFEFLKKFPNIEIRYNDRLHAKFYQNDHDFILTSMNLYDYSLAKNIEVGIKCSYASKGLIGRALDSTNMLVLQGVDKVKHELLGVSKGDLNPLEKFHSIFYNSDLKYKTEPIVEEQSGVMGLINTKKLKGFNVTFDNLSIASKQAKESKPTVVGALPEVGKSTTPGKPQSASQLSKALGISAGEITYQMEVLGLISGGKITQKGHDRGLVMKNYMGNDYIAYPDNLAELLKLKK
jgi:hypothetical protein